MIMTQQAVQDVAVVIIRAGSRVLCTQRSASQSFPLTWVWPGGKHEPEETPEQAARREIREETGIQLPSVVLVGTVIREGYRFWVWESQIPNPCPVVLNEECDGFGWFTESEAARLTTAGHLKFGEWEELVKDQMTPRALSTQEASSASA